jgi:hypothetical protein
MVMQTLVSPQGSTETTFTVVAGNLLMKSVPVCGAK